ncbi:MAG: hypothetical protein Fur0018_04200 [Anaerolineales bacterium]
MISSPFTLWQEFALLTLTGMEIAAFAPWGYGISPAITATPYVRFLWLAWFFVLVTAAVGRLAGNLRLRKNIRNLLLGLALAAGVWAGLRLWVDPHVAQDMQALYTQPLNGIEEAPRVIPAWFWGLIFAFLLWWRGVFLGRERIGPLFVMRSFKAGVISLALLALSDAAARPARPAFSAALLFVFLACALLALVTSRVSTLERLRGGHRNPFDRRWGAILTGSVLSIAVSGLGGALLLAGRVDFIGQVLETLAVFLGAVLLSPFLLLLALLQPAFDVMLQAVPQNAATPMPTLSAPQLPDFSDLQQAGAQVPVDMRPMFLALGGLALLILVVLILRAAGGRLEAPASSALRDSSEHDSLADGLRRRMQALAERLSGVGGLSLAQRRRAAAHIRKIYAEFTALCARHDVARPAAVTPLEFIPLTAGLLPEAQGEVRMLTEAYLRVRYGELPESQDEIRQVDAAWQRVKEQMMS